MSKHFPQPKNLRQHDLVLFAKYHYQQSGSQYPGRAFTALKMLIQYHNGWDLSSLPSDKDTLSVLLTDTLEFFIGDPQKVYTLLLSGQPEFMGGVRHEEIGYYELQSLNILGTIAHTIAVKFPFLPCELDLELEAMLNSYDVQREYGFQN